MEPISVSTLLTLFFGYFVGTDLLNYTRFREHHCIMLDRLTSIEDRLSSIRNKY